MAGSSLVAQGLKWNSKPTCRTLSSSVKNICPFTSKSFQTRVLVDFAKCMELLLVKTICSLISSSPQPQKEHLTPCSLSSTQVPWTNFKTIRECLCGERIPPFLDFIFEIKWNPIFLPLIWKIKILFIEKNRRMFFPSLQSKYVAHLTTKDWVAWKIEIIFLFTVKFSRCAANALEPWA